MERITAGEASAWSADLPTVDGQVILREPMIGTSWPPRGVGYGQLFFGSSGKDLEQIPWEMGTAPARISSSSIDDPMRRGTGA